MATGNNNNQAVRRYEKKFAKMLPTVFEAKAYFADFFNGLEVLDDIEENAKAFSYKACNIPVVIGDYDTDEDTAFGDGTSNSNRFGERTEVIYENIDVPYNWTWAIHEGLDKATVNNKLDAAVADRLDLQAQAKMAKFNSKHSKFISDSVTEGAIQTVDEELTEAIVTKLFNDMSKYFINKKTVGRKIAKVNADIWNILIDMGLTTKEKESSVNIDNNEMVKFKGFEVQELPDEAFQTGECAYFYIAGVGISYTGIATTRTFPSEDFDGVALQGRGRAGEYILPDNKVAVAKAVFQ